MTSEIGTLGELLPDWQAPKRPFAEREDTYRAVGAKNVDTEPSLLAPVDGVDWSSPVLVGKYSALVPLHVGHAEALFKVFSETAEGATTSTEDVWKYLSMGPFGTLVDFRAWIKNFVVPKRDFFFMTILDGPDAATAQPVGLIAYGEIEPHNGHIEVGWVTYSPLLQRTRASTEVQFLMMRYIFEQGYRRYHWKCNALNVPSRRAAQRYGFSFEGVLRQRAVVKGRNRDTAIFSILDSEWPAVHQAFQLFLDNSNFDPETAKQIVALSTLTAPLLTTRDPSL